MSDWELQLLRESLEELKVFSRNDPEKCMQDGVALCITAFDPQDWLDIAYMVGDYEELVDTEIECHHRYGDIDADLSTAETVVIVGPDKIFHKIHYLKIKVIRRTQW